jgi:hypothetical protein
MGDLKREQVSVTPSRRRGWVGNVGSALSRLYRRLLPHREPGPCRICGRFARNREDGEWFCGPCLDEWRDGKRY